MNKFPAIDGQDHVAIFSYNHPPFIMGTFSKAQGWYALGFAISAVIAFGLTLASGGVIYSSKEPPAQCNASYRSIGGGVGLIASGIWGLVALIHIIGFFTTSTGSIWSAKRLNHVHLYGDTIIGITIAINIGLSIVEFLAIFASDIVARMDNTPTECRMEFENAAFHLIILAYLFYGLSFFFAWLYSSGSTETLETSSLSLPEEKQQLVNTVALQQQHFPQQPQYVHQPQQAPHEQYPPQYEGQSNFMQSMLDLQTSAAHKYA